jgi:thiol-disulfide isomerase/thioredoxin
MAASAMRQMVWASVYTGLTLMANAAAADVSAARPLATGDMAKLVFTDPPQALPQVPLADAGDAAASLDPYAGKWMVVNFWATWCAPCRKEMPSLAALADDMPDLAVVPIATGRNAVEGIQRFYAEVGVTDRLPLLRDPKAEMAHQMGVLGLPVTLIVNPEGQEVARLIGGAEWNSPEALAVLKALMAP